MSTEYRVGSLVRARGREWVVAESQHDLLMLRPLGGADDELAGVYLPLEKVEPARFDLPDPQRVGDHRSCRLLRDAVRLSSRAGAGPFRSLSRIAVEPRPYQLVPLLMALKLDPVRLLIADDVGIGKTIEALLVARELLDRGEVRRLAVLCPPHLAEQWHLELRTKFHLDAELVLSSTVTRLERDLGYDQSLFERYRVVVVSMDFIKSERRRTEFLRNCPELVIVDEAHTCSWGSEQRGRHQRHEIVRQLSADPNRHLLLVSATPHTGNEASFRSLLTFLDADFADLPPDMSGAENEKHRRRLAAHLVQRRRPDLKKFLDVETNFPDREEAETHYKLSPEYREFFQRVLTYIRETVEVDGLGRTRQRVRWWSALALLRSVASSPAAAAATLRSRAPTVEAESPEQVDAIGRRSVLDLETDEEIEGVDVAPGADPNSTDTYEGSDTPDRAEARRLRERLLKLAHEADALEGANDSKLQGAVKLVKELLKDKYNPIVFCRFIPTAEYVGRELSKRLGKSVRVETVTGLLPSEEREERVLSLRDSEQRVLVCTDCLSEGVNLQDLFDSVVHYDLAWSPTRHEQRQGRVDRFGQKRKIVRALMYYGVDNGIDGIVLDVLLRKHRKIRSSLGISVPVPVETNAVVDAILEGLLLREQSGSKQQLLPFLEEHVRPKRDALDLEWDRASEREKRSRTLFAQETIKVEEVGRELEATRQSIGSSADVARFVKGALAMCGAVTNEKPDHVEFELGEVSRTLRDLLGGGPPKLKGRFDLPTPKDVEYLSRTHPAVQGLSTYVLDGALDIGGAGPARRCGAVRTRAVATRTTLLILRLRFDLHVRAGDERTSHLAEEVRLLAFQGAPDAATWLDETGAEALLSAEPDGNIEREQASTFVRRVVEGYSNLLPRIEAEARARASILLEAHERVRSAARARRFVHDVEPQLPADVIGIFVLLPAVAKG